MLKRMLPIVMAMLAIVLFVSTPALADDPAPGPDPAASAPAVEPGSGDPASPDPAAPADPDAEPAPEPAADPDAAPADPGAPAPDPDTPDDVVVALGLYAEINAESEALKAEISELQIETATAETEELKALKVELQRRREALAEIRGYVRGRTEGLRTRIAALEASGDAQLEAFKANLTRVLDSVERALEAVENSVTLSAAAIRRPAPTAAAASAPTPGSVAATPPGGTTTAVGGYRD